MRIERSLMGGAHDAGEDLLGLSTGRPVTGIEGTSSYGAGLARAARRAGHRVTDVNRGDRRLRRAAGKSDTIDAEAAARSG